MATRVMESSFAEYPTGIFRYPLPEIYAFVSRTAALTKALAAVFEWLLVTSLPAKNPRTLSYLAKMSTTLVYRWKISTLHSGSARLIEVLSPGAERSEMI